MANHQRERSSEGRNGQTGRNQMNRGRNASSDRGRKDQEPTGNWGSSDSDGQFEDDSRSTRAGSSRDETYIDRDREYRGNQEDYEAGTRSMESRGPHAGKGPKGYRRPDSRIEDEVNEALSRDGALDASDIEVKVEDGEVTLSGTVPDRDSKRRAEECVENCFGVEHVQNNVRVAKENGDNRANGNANSTNGSSKQHRATTH